jgi:hypothetical protein
MQKPSGARCAVCVAAREIKCGPRQGVRDFFSSSFFSATRTDRLAWKRENHTSVVTMGTPGSTGIPPAVVLRLRTRSKLRGNFKSAALVPEATNFCASAPPIVEEVAGQERDHRQRYDEEHQDQPYRRNRKIAIVAVSLG